MRNCVAHAKPEAGLKIDFISALELPCSKASCHFLGQWNFTAELTVSKAAKRNQKRLTMNSDSSLQIKGDPYGLQRQWCPEGPGLYNQFNHQIDQRNTQTWSEPLLCLSSSVPAGWHLTTHSNFTPWALLCRACHNLACQCLLQLCAQYLIHLIFQVAVLMAAQAACVLSAQQGPSRPGGTLLGDLGFQSTIIRLPRFVQITLCSPEIWEGSRKKANSQARLAFFDSFEQTNRAKKQYCRWESVVKSCL